jgi:hypothetical protein
MNAHITPDGCLSWAAGRNERWQAAKAFVAEGLADEGEFARLLCAIGRDGVEVIRERLEGRREMLTAAEAIVSDFFAFEAAVRL